MSKVAGIVVFTVLFYQGKLFIAMGTGPGPLNNQERKLHFIYLYQGAHNELLPIKAVCQEGNTDG